MPKRLSEIIDAFFKGIARSRVSLIGALLTTIVFPFLLGLIILDLWMHLENPYLGAIIYMVLGPAFILGLVMVFIGLFFLKGKEDVRLFTVGYLREHFTDETRFDRVRKLIFLGVFLTAVNFFIFGLLGYSGYHYMESNAFCGQFCHTVMNPEYTAYQNSPHSRVKCVECHIGSGATWFAKSKISGARQLFATALDTYPRPIETPVHGLRPARETCEECHRPEKFHGDRLLVKHKYRPDEENTHLKTVLLMKIGSAGGRVQSPHGIHWHVAPENEMTYKADYDRMVIPEVTQITADGEKKVYKSSTDLDPEDLDSRKLDCVDCHNRPTHIYRGPDEALDEKIFAEEIPRELPYIKKQAREVITRSYETKEEALETIEEELETWYSENYPELIQKQPDLLQAAISGTQEAYSLNVFPSMNIEWNTYPSHLGHGEYFDSGCFRCHDGSHETDDGEVISSDCSTCHTILADEEEDPEILERLQVN